MRDGDSTLYAFHLGDEVWRSGIVGAGSELPCARFGHTLVGTSWDGGSLVLVGGCAVATGALLNDVWVYSIKQCRWRRLCCFGTLHYAVTGTAKSKRCR